jgi:hypothetical protein
MYNTIKRNRESLGLSCLPDEMGYYIFVNSYVIRLLPPFIFCIEGAIIADGLIVGNEEECHV